MKKKKIDKRILIAVGIVVLLIAIFLINNYIPVPVSGPDHMPFSCWWGEWNETGINITSDEEARELLIEYDILIKYNREYARNSNFDSNITSIISIESIEPIERLTREELEILMGESFLSQLNGELFNKIQDPIFVTESSEVYVSSNGIVFNYFCGV